MSEVTKERRDAESIELGEGDSPIKINGGEVSALHDLFAGGVAGSASVIVGHPFDTIKVRMQTQTSIRGGNSSPLATFRSLFSGMGAPLSSAAIVNAIIFASYGSLTRSWENTLEDRPERHANLHGVISGEGAVFLGDEQQLHSAQSTQKNSRAEARFCQGFHVRFGRGCTSGSGNLPNGTRQM